MRKKIRLTTRLLLFLFAVTIIAVAGCSNEQLKTEQGLRDQVKVLQDENARLKNELERLQKQQGEERDYTTQERQQAVTLHSRQLSDRDAQIADLRQELANLVRINIALEGAAGADLMSKRVQQQFVTSERVFWVLLIGVSWIVTIVLGILWWRARERYHNTFLQTVTAEVISVSIDRNKDMVT